MRCGRTSRSAQGEGETLDAFFKRTKGADKGTKRVEGIKRTEALFNPKPNMVPRSRRNLSKNDQNPRPVGR